MDSIITTVERALRVEPGGGERLPQAGWRQGGAAMVQRFAMMHGNSALLQNRKMSHKLRHKWRCELSQIIELKIKHRPPLAK
ncbi:MAG: hypothetical protein LBK66_06015 [Spirochaetaceae bacterium]|jgi:hypothetical protein|nr:hypothetical protein [Spirochaetaceae bacterium]